MKLLNIFKKATKISSKQNVQTLDKKQLAQVIGGTETSGNTTGSGSGTTTTDKPKTVTINTSHVE